MADGVQPFYQKQIHDVSQKNLYLLVVLNLEILPPQKFTDILLVINSDETHFQSLSRPSRDL